MNGHIIEFENLNYLMENQNLNLPNKVLAFKLLDGTTISENQQQMCLMLAHDLTFNSMKTALKRIFSDKNTLKESQYFNQFENFNIKREESVFVVDQNTKLKRKTNPKDKKGEITRCIMCESKVHWAKSCPHKSNYVVNVTESLSEIEHEAVCDEEVNIILMKNEYEILISEMETNAIIDTACTKTVSGEKWFLNFIKCLDDTALNKVQVIPSRKVFEFGDGRKISPKYKAIIPAKMGKTKCYIQTEIVNEKIQLWLSKSIIKEGRYLHKYQR